MDEDGFIAYLKKMRKSDMTIVTCVSNIKRFEQFLVVRDASLDNSSYEDLEKFALEIIGKSKVSKFMWALSYYFGFNGNIDLQNSANKIRSRIIGASRKPFKLKDFRGVESDHIEILSKHGIHDTAKMLEVGKTAKQREDLAAKTGLTIDSIIEFVKLSDLARLPGVKSIRARLYHDAGIDTIEKLAKMSPEILLQITRKFVEETGFDGIPPLPKEAQSSISTARQLSKLVEW